MAKHPAIFLDRDGTIIEDKGHIGSHPEIAFYPYTFQALRILQKHFLLFIITNQSGVAKGLIPETNVKDVHRHIVSDLKAQGITIYDVFYCPHKTDDNCVCKKPKPYFIHTAAQLYNIDLTKSYMIGDHPSDVECGINAGVTPIYLLSGHGQEHMHELKHEAVICENILEATKYISNKNDLLSAIFQTPHTPASGHLFPLFEREGESIAVER